MKKELSQGQKDGVAWFKKYCPKGSTVYTVIRSVSRSRMSRVIGLVVIVPGKPGEEPVMFHPNYSAARVLGYRMAPGSVDGLKVSGCGMDMGFHVVYSLAQAVYGDGYALKQRWI